jgi:8-amino-7-oxononanoate synthase
MSESGAQPAKHAGDIFAKLDSNRMAAYRVASPLPQFPFYRELDGEIGPHIRFEGRDMINLGSNNYLGLTTDPRVRAAATDAIHRYGTGVTGSRLLNGTLPIHRQLEERLAAWVGMEAALVFTTGYAANLGLIASLVDGPDAVFVDSAAHASLVDGATLAAGQLRAFRHNRPNSLRRGLRSWREHPDAGGVLVAVDGIYSMEGDWAPLEEIAGLCHEYGARLLVDEAHALGVAGPKGAGTAAAMGVRPDLVMGTFSKSLASCGGFIAGSQAFVDFLKVNCRTLQFTASGTPSALAAALAALELAQSEDWRREAVVARAEQLRDGLHHLGYDIGASAGSAIVPVHVGDDWEAGALWLALLDSGVYTNCAIPPAVPRALLRTSVMATHGEQDLDRALAAFEGVRRSRQRRGPGGGRAGQGGEATGC